MRREAIEALREENEKLQAQLHEEKEKRVAEQQRLKVRALFIDSNSVS